MSCSAFPGQTVTDEVLASLATALAHSARVRAQHLFAQLNRGIGGHFLADLELARSIVSEPLRSLKNAGLIAGAVDCRRV